MFGLIDAFLLLVCVKLLIGKRKVSGVKEGGEGSGKGAYVVPEHETQGEASTCRNKRPLRI